MSDVIENWRPVAGYEDAYEVSDRGRLKSLSRPVRTKAGAFRTLPERVFVPRTLPNGYVLAALWRGGRAVGIGVHCLVARAFLGLGPNAHVDHIDRNRSNNTPGNLRAATPRQNTGNAKLNARNSSGFKGVSWCRTKNKWRARLCTTTNGVRSTRSLGLHPDARSAALAYDTAALAKWGDFAATNHKLGLLQ